MRFGQKGIITLASYPAEEILALTSAAECHPMIFVVKNVKYTVNMASDRYQTFKKSSHCECCRIKGTLMVLQKFCDGPKHKAHFNLYGANDKGDMVLFTKDHIVPVSKGGKNHPDNFRTLCSRCNCIRGNKDVTMEQLRSIVTSWSSKSERTEKHILGKRKRRNARNLEKIRVKLILIPSQILKKGVQAVFQVVVSPSDTLVSRYSIGVELGALTKQHHHASPSTFSID